MIGASVLDRLTMMRRKLVVWLFLLVRLTYGFQPPLSVSVRIDATPGVTKTSLFGLPDEISRRFLLESVGASGSLLWTTATTRSTNLLPEIGYSTECLLDLPPTPDDCVRLYLCRHGQTDNNKYNRVQGARIDAPINETGERMAQRLGQAFGRLKEPPKQILYSPLIRAQRTAEIAASRFGGRLAKLNSLLEVDFGPVVDGKDIATVRADMVRTYTAWSSGFIDRAPAGGGESGRQILTRAVDTLDALVEAAKGSGGSVAAVTHSRYIRMLLAVVLDESLAESIASQQANCCINVLDMKADGSHREAGPKSPLVGGPLSFAPEDFSLLVPAGNAIRVNECRHLQDLL